MYNHRPRSCVQLEFESPTEFELEALAKASKL